MIYHDITGNSVSGASQLLDLIKLVANPKEYEAKIKALEEVTAANKKIVEAVGPASEIPVLLERAKVSEQIAKAELAAAKAEAAKVRSDVKKQAAATLEAAEKSASSLKAEAASILEQAKSNLELVEKMKADVQFEHDNATALQKNLDVSLRQLSEEKAEVDLIKKEVEGLRQTLRKKLDDIAKAADL